MSDSITLTGLVATPPRHVAVEPQAEAQPDEAETDEADVPAPPVPALLASGRVSIIPVGFAA